MSLRRGGRERRIRRNGFLRRGRRLARLAAAEQALQQAWAVGFGRGFQLAQGLALQAAQFAEQQGNFPRLANPAIQLLGKGFQRTADLPGQGQGLQLADQRRQRAAHLLDPGFPPLLGVQHGFFQARQQGCKPGVHVVGAYHLAHFLHALVDRAIGALRRQGAAYQATTQQVETGRPSAFELFLLFDTFEVFLFPAIGVVAHSSVPRGAGLNAGNASAVSEPGRRISTATGR